MDIEGLIKISFRLYCMFLESQKWEREGEHKLRIFRSVALRCIDLGKNFGLFGSSTEFQKTERQISFSIHTRRATYEQIQYALGIYS